jgi:lactaldehyde reductase
MSNRFVLNETSYHGAGAIKDIATEAQGRGFKKAFVCSDPDLVKFGVTKKVLDVLEGANLDYELYSNIKPNPTIENVQTGVEAFKKSGADYLVAIGGGSSMDTAKAIGIIIKNPDFEDVVSLEGVAPTKNKSVPIFAVPTTAGTAAEVTINYVITDEEREMKMVCVDPHDIPVLAIVDSELMESMPKSIAASTGMDALTHAIEGYITSAHNTMSDMFHMRAIELIFENLPAAVNQKDPKAVENMALAQYIAGMGFSNVGLGIVHSMAHQLGAVYDTPHGMANAILLPTVMRFNGEVSWERFREILMHIGRPDAANLNKQDIINTFVWKITELSKEVGITQTVGQVGAKEEDIEMLAEKAMQDPCKPGNPREVTKEDFMELYKKAW